MKLKSLMPWSCVLGILSLSVTSCDDWGREDPPAGGQIYPTLENVASYDFNSEEGLDPSVFTAVSHNGGETPDIVEDSQKGSVLSLNNGHVSMSNPLNSVVLQNAASFTGWFKQPTEADLEFSKEEAEGRRIATRDDETEGEEEIESIPMDEKIIASPLFTLQDEDSGSYLKLTPGGKLEFSSEAGTYTVEGTNAVAGKLTAGEWHYLAAIVGNEGYELYLDGECALSEPVADFDFSKVVAFANTAPVMTIGSSENTNHIYVDDVAIYRNRLSQKEIDKPSLGGGSGGGGGSQGGNTDSWILLGEEDNSTGFWTTWGDYLNLTGDGTVHYEFYNYNGGTTNNWCNWGLVLTNGLKRDEAGYSEYLYLRADAWGWASSWDVGTIEHDFIWDDNLFNIEMDGAYVTLDITRKGSTVTVLANVTTSTGGTRYEKFTADNISTEVLGTFLTCEGSHLLIDANSVFVGTSYNPGENVLGATDFTTGWWAAHSPNNKFTGPFTNWGVEFVNHNSGSGANWNNWLLVCTNGTWIGEDGYAENFVLRSDAFGWGPSFDAGNTTMESAFDWDNYVQDMKNCKVKLLFSYDGDTLKMVCHQTTGEGKEMPVYKFTSSGMPAPIGLFFTIENAWLDFERIGYYPWAVAE